MLVYRRGKARTGAKGPGCRNPGNPRARMREACQMGGSGERDGEDWHPVVCREGLKESGSTGDRLNEDFWP